MPTPTPPPATALVGRGFKSDVYAWGDGHVLKLFHAGTGRDNADREYLATRAVHAAGLPAPTAHEVVEVGGRWGVVFDRVDGPSLFEYVQARPWALPWAVRLLAALHAAIHRCAGPAELPTLRERLAGKIDAADHPSAAERDAARRRLATLPDGTALCHGDFHPANVLMTARGPVVIDWEGATRGHPLGDVAVTSRLIRTAPVPPWAPWVAHLLLRGTRPLLSRRYLKHYFRLQPGMRREVEAWQVPLAAAARVFADQPRAASEPRTERNGAQRSGAE
jgi:aminoglycoside phosphotransferase (APT) family kinase protein